MLDRFNRIVSVIDDDIVVDRYLHIYVYIYVYIQKRVDISMMFVCDASATVGYM